MRYTVTLDHGGQPILVVTADLERARQVYAAAPLRAGYRLTLTDADGGVLAIRVGGDPVQAAARA